MSFVMAVWDIKSIPLFNDHNPAQVHNLIEIVHKIEYKKGGLICKWGEKTREVFIISKGSVEIRSQGGARLNILKEKEIFGEIGFVYGLERSATVVAREDTTLLAINHTLMENLSKSDPMIKTVLIRNLLTSLSDKLIQANIII